MRLTAAQKRVGLLLAEQEEGGLHLTFQEAAARLGYHAISGVHRLVRALSDGGLIERTTHFHACRLTTAGWQAIGRPPPHAGVPVLGAIAAGAPILAEEHLAGHLADLRPRAGRFALRIQGDSMIDAHIYDGDFAIIDSERAVHTGEVGAVLVDQEATLKYCHFSSHGLRLVAANPAVPDRHLDHHRDDWRILGALVLVVRPWGTGPLHAFVDG